VSVPARLSFVTLAVADTVAPAAGAVSETIGAEMSTDFTVTAHASAEPEVASSPRLSRDAAPACSVRNE
jgi:hypothetical protein